MSKFSNVKPCLNVYIYSNTQSSSQKCLLVQLKSDGFERVGDGNLSFQKGEAEGNHVFVFPILKICSCLSQQQLYNSAPCIQIMYLWLDSAGLHVVMTASDAVCSELQQQVQTCNGWILKQFYEDPVNSVKFTFGSSFIMEP